MFWVVLVVRVLVGLTFFVTALNHFFDLFTIPKPTATPSAEAFAGALVSSGYMNAVKVLELTGGALLLSGRFVLVGLALVTPVAVNIALFDVFLMRAFGPGLVLAALCFFLVVAYRKHFAPVFAFNPKIG